MFYDRVSPKKSLSTIIDCYWIVENEDSTVFQQKIIPDGFPEMIFHYGDNYRVNISGSWETQSKSLLAGQIRNHFLLENTGTSGMIGIKFKPASITQLFDINMLDLTDKVVELGMELYKQFEPIIKKMDSKALFKKTVRELDSFFEQQTREETENDRIINLAIDLIFQEKGMISVTNLTTKTGVNERKLERLFNKYIGLSPKFYSRIIRFNHIFQLVQEKQVNWSEIAQLSGFYDQSHFISNFQEFTGEDPSKYFFDDPTLANFFLKRPVEK